MAGILLPLAKVLVICKEQLCIISNKDMFPVICPVSPESTTKYADADLLNVKNALGGNALSFLLATASGLLSIRREDFSRLNEGDSVGYR